MELGIDSKQAKHFFKKLAVVSLRYRKRQNAVGELNKHINRIKEQSTKKKFQEDMDMLHSKIKEVVKSEKGVRYMHEQNSNEVKLRKQLQELEMQLEYERAAKERALEINRKRIDQITKAVLLLKDHMQSLMQEKEKKTKRKAELEKKINSTFSH